MVDTLKQRITISFLVAVLAAFAGAGRGYVLGRAITLKLAESRLDQYATSILNVGSSNLDEAHAILGSMSASPVPNCSDADIDYLRNLVFQSQSVKDAGRMHDGRILCSANFGRLKQPSTQFKPDFIQPNGTRLYKNMGPYRIKNLTVVSMQLGDLYAVLNPDTERRMNSSPLHYTVTSQAMSSQPQVLGGFPGAPRAILTRDSQGRFVDVLYVTRCSSRYSTCITAYTPVFDAVQSGYAGILRGIVSGGVIGAAFGLFFLFLYLRSHSMEKQLRRAIRKGTLQMVYQPIVELVQRRIVGAEALVRWTDEDGFPVGPDVFVKVAEERGFVGELTRLIVHSVVRDLGEILRENPDFRLSINVTAADLADPEFLPMLDRSLNNSGIAAQSLIVEITESSTARNKVAIETIRLLHQRGHGVHIDDFGTGYSSLAYLHELSIDAIKIDRAFTRAIGTEAVTTTILPQICAMAKALSLRIVVEGVETEEQACYFADSDMPILAQGWLFGRPVPAEEFQRVLLDNNQRSMSYSVVD